MSTIESLERRPSPAARLRRGPREAAASQPWVAPAVVALLTLTAVAYVFDLNASGNANAFYAAAAQAATKSWKAFFFGSLDASNFITVDKPPASLWVMALSGRLFGFSSWSMLVPQALEGVAAVGLLYAAVRRWFGPAAGLAAGAVLALTPVAALMFRFNNPDALLVMLLVAAAYTLTRSLEAGRTRWLVATGTLIGFAFLAKMGQALLVVPGFGMAYLIAAPVSLRRRMAGLAAGFGAMVVAAGWWVAIVALLPESSRPLIDGTRDDSIVNLIFGYGLSRLFGGGQGGAGGGGGGANFSGSAGTLRLFNDLLGGQASWLLPAALVALAAGLWARRRAPRTDRIRAALIVWGGWLLVTAAVFSYSQGVIHTYYAVALAPAIGGLAAIGATLAWRHRDGLRARALTAAVIALTGAWSYVLLDRTPSFEPWLRPLILAATAVAAAGWLAAPAVARRGRRATVTVLAAAAIAALAGPAAYTVETIATPHTGSVPSAGPTLAVATTAPGGPSTSTAVPGGGAAPSGSTPLRGAAGTRPSGAPSSGASGAGALPGGASGGSFAGTGTRGGASGAGPGRASVSAALARALERDAGSYRWVAATDGSTSASSYELATGGEPVMAIGGFNGNGGELGLAQFIRYVRAGDIHYYIASGGGMAGAGGSSSSTTAITSWVESHFTARTIGGTTVYDLSS